MLCTNCHVAKTGRKMADCKAEKKKRRCCLVLVTVQRILPEKSGLTEGQAVENVAVDEQYSAMERKKEGDNLLQLRAYSPLPLVAAEDASDN
jgi:hypothetical protein